MARTAHILVVDDNLDARDALRKLLEGAGHTVTCIVNGDEALRWLGNGSRPDVILMDLWMPVVDGWKFRQRLWQNPELEQIPVVLISGEGDLAQIAASLDVDAYFRKPVDPKQLLQAIGALGGGEACSYFTE
jgi:two-component system, OmpR family, response regulator CpxR